MPEVVFVGTGDAFGSGGRRNSAILVRGSPGTLLLDCGPTTLGGLKALGIDPGEIDAIALSHYHADHVAGVPFLMLDYRFEGARRRELVIAGPPGVREHVTRLNDTFCYSENALTAYPLHWCEFDRARELEIGGFRVTTCAAHHHPETCPHMIRVRVDGKTVFFTGDTGWHEDLPRQVADADLFISECVFMEERFDFHLSHARLERERKKFRARRVVLTHLGSEVLGSLEKVRFDLAEDGMRLSF
jgi:ribonuclease BN (tRNA processing enzyme)